MSDGELTMLMADLLTLKHHDLRTTVIVFRNDALAFVEFEMKAGRILKYNTAEESAFAEMADAAGVLELLAKTSADVRPDYRGFLARWSGAGRNPSATSGIIKAAEDKP